MKNKNGPQENLAGHSDLRSAYFNWSRISFLLIFPTLVFGISSENSIWLGMAHLLISPLSTYLQVALNIFHSGLLARLQVDQSIGALSPLLIRNAHHGSTCYGRVLADQVFQIQ